MAMICIIMVCLVASTVAQDHVYTTNEETGKAHYLGNIPQDVDLREIATPNAPKRSFKILNGGKKVSVDPITGDLSTAVQLDRERLCPENPQKCIIDVEVVVMPPFRLVKVQFVVEDLNDNEPNFPSQLIVKDISESAAIGSVIRLDSAVDPDLGANSIQQYKISSSPPSSKDSDGVNVGCFHLDVLENIDGTKIPQLNLTTKLDREQIASYELLLYAIDGGSTPLTGTATVKITVTDSNDNQPYFPESNYVREVPEDETPGSLVIQVTATDLDAGSNADIAYSFPSVVSAHDRAVFSLDENTGAITIKKTGLDYENKTIHHLTVEARDRGPNPASAYTTVTIKVVDVNDEAPQIDVSFMDFIEKKNPTTDTGGREAILIKEDIANDTYIAFVTVTDRDTGINGKISCKIRDPSSFELMDLDKEQNRYLIRTKGQLDREDKRFHNIEIVASDAGSPSLRNSTTILVELIDVNDNPPKFGQSKYNVFVSETIENGEELTKIMAHDPDDGLNAEITYTSEPGDENDYIPFAVDPQTGSVTFKSGVVHLDAENSTEPFILRVTATDHGTPKLSSTTLLTINVQDENDNKPIFRQQVYDFRIREDSKRGTYVGQVTADDADIDKATNARITYNFAQDSSEPIPFTIKEDTGQIHFDGEASQIDREERQSRPYILTVKAWDHGKIAHSADATVEIYLEDVNDNAPKIISPNVTKDFAIVYISMLNKVTEGKRTNSDFAALMDNLSVVKQLIRIGNSSATKTSVPDSLPIVVTRIIAKDLDASENGHVRYTLSEGNTYGYFAMDMPSGNITLVYTDPAKLRAMKHGCQVIKITVSDLGKPTPKTSFGWVNIYITDATPGTLNVSDVMKDCQNNSFYPIFFTPKNNDIAASGTTKLLYILIISFVAVFAVIFIVVVVLIIKYKCHCGRNKQSRTYNCQAAAGLYSDASYAAGSPVVKKGRNKGSPFSEKATRLNLPNGTVDSRSSNYSDWTASQLQIPQEKNELMMRVEQYDGSVGSQNSARDSGTGDSVPNDAYGGPSNFRQTSFQRQQQQPSYHQQQYQPTHVCLPQQGSISPDYTAGAAGDDIAFHPHLPYQQQPPVGFSKCTQDCSVMGHGDNCWMPDTLQRPPSRMTSFKGNDVYDTGSMGKSNRALSPTLYQRNETPEFQHMRYTNAPSNTPYYYDPGSKFEGSIPARSNFSTFRDDSAPSDGGSPALSQVASSSVSRQPSINSYRQYGGYSQGQSQASRVKSPVIINAATPVPYGAASRGKAYINLQGTGVDGGQQVDETHSNLSGSSSSNIQHSDYSHNYSQQNYQVSSYQQPDYSQQYVAPHEQHPLYGEQQGYTGYVSESGYDDEFAATNLLLSPADSEPGDYKQRLERQMQQQQSNYQPPYNYSGGETPDDQHLLEKDADRLPETNPSIDKLSTIREELDADEVVAEIDGLLL